jgi:hypothetical protein
MGMKAYGRALAMDARDPARNAYPSWFENLKRDIRYKIQSFRYGPKYTQLPPRELLREAAEMRADSAKLSAYLKSGQSKGDEDNWAHEAERDHLLYMAKEFEELAAKKGAGR